MNRTIKLNAVLLQGVVLLACAGAPAFAAATPTDVFLANVAPDVDFLDRSSRMALDHTKNAKLRTFAHSEAAEQTLAANVLDDWIEKYKGSFVALNTPANPDQVVTGRSVAIDRPTASPPDIAPPAVGQEDLDRLDGLADREFEDLYKSKQMDALTQLSATYSDYIANGDDPALKAMAQSELPKINRRLAALRRL